jgi:hypothetical protein
MWDRTYFQIPYSAPGGTSGHRNQLAMTLNMDEPDRNSELEFADWGSLR